MPKKFWLDCIKIFLRTIIPTLGAIFSFICLFSNDFENTLKDLGILGVILFFCMFFALTLILELTGLIKVMDDIQKGVVKKEDLFNKSIYSYFKNSKKEIGKKRKKNIYSKKEKTKCTESVAAYFIDDEYFKDFHYYSFKIDLNDYIKSDNDKVIENYFLKWGLTFFDIDVIQESFFIFFSYGIWSIIEFFEENLEVSLPELILYDYSSGGFKELYNKIKQNSIFTIVNKFEGKVEDAFSGYCIIGFDRESMSRMKEILEERYSQYISDYSKMILSLMKELSSRITLSGLTCISDLIFSMILNKDERPLFKIVNGISSNNLESISLESNFVVVREVVKMKYSKCSLYLYLVMEINSARKFPELFINEIIKKANI